MQHLAGINILTFKHEKKNAFKKITFSLLDIGIDDSYLVYEA